MLSLQQHSFSASDASLNIDKESTPAHKEAPPKQQLIYINGWNYTTALLFTVNVAGGHLSAADALESNIKEHYPQAIIERIELCESLFGRHFSKVLSGLWNGSQRSEWTFVLLALQAMQPLFDIIFYLPMLFFTLRRINKAGPTAILSTQPIGSWAMVHAVRLYNWWKDKTLRVHLFLTEESGRCPHYFKPLRALSSRSRTVFTLHAPRPVVNEDESDDERFWKKHTGLSFKKGEVLYSPPLVRPGFWRARPRPQCGIDAVEHLINGEEHIDLIKQILTPQQKYELKIDKTQSMIVSTHIGSEDSVILIMLARQACSGATLAYLEGFVAHYEALLENSTTCHLYVACGNNDNLFKEVCFLAQARHSLQQRGLNIIPLDFQDDATLGQVMKFCDFTITKSGGMTIQELQVAAPTAKHYIHVPQCCYDTINKNINAQKAERHMVIPEWENYCALAKKCNAQLITPTPLPRELFQPSFAN